ncbi:polysaccharide deacetylase family protein [Paenibacillus thailandensis]|uniref:Polysaccharide deacetylase family protein n=1 Tax=Paenibacillus thailandensis TaxID=393250 RepID=A0ABW5QQM5_9BACL
MINNLLLWAFYFMTLYAFIPALVSRLFGFRVFKKGLADKEIALTFDDGPDAEYTPQLLELLARYDAKATFFVVGSHAEDKAQLLKRMHEEGHVIGIHNYVHKSNWFMLPRTVTRHIQQTNDIIEQAIGIRAAYYRPPWGIMNCFDFRSSTRHQIVLWSSLFGDWNVKLGAEQLTRRIMRKLRPGEVLLLHDCGRTPGADAEAPGEMLKALEYVLEEGTRRGFRFVAIDEMMDITERNEKKRKEQRTPMWKKTLIAGWLVYEKAFQAVFRLKHGGSIFHYRKIRYGGKPLELADGRRIVKGDPVIEIHFDNRKLSSIAMNSKSPIAATVKLKRETEHGLAELAGYLAHDEEAREAKAVYGVTMVHRGADRIGFELFPLPDGWFARSSKVYLRILMRVLTNNKPGSNDLKPQILIMPMNRLLPLATDEKQQFAALRNATRTAAAPPAVMREDGDPSPMRGNTPAL